MRKAVLILISSVTLAIFSGCHIERPSSARFTRTETRILELQAGGQLRALTFNGTIRVEGWERDEISLVAEIRERREGDVLFRAESRGGLVEIITEGKKRNAVFVGFGYGELNGASYMLKIPKRTMATLISSNGGLEIRQIDGEIDATTSNASITASEIGGKARLSTSNGAIWASTINGEIDATTSNASITANEIGGKARLSTSNGTIWASTINGGLIARSSNGRLDIKDVLGSAELRSSNGRIEVRGVEGKTDAFTSNGSIIAENIKDDLIGKSSNGGIDIEKVLGAIDVSTSNASISAANIDGKGRGIRLATSNGSIDVALGQARGLLEASTSGNKRSNVRIQIPNVQPTSDGSAIRAKIGDSDQPIELKTTTGRITVR